MSLGSDGFMQGFSESRHCDPEPEEDVRSAWVNWNPDPLIHAYGSSRLRSALPIAQRVVLALCRVTVREPRGEFNPDDPKACPDCAQFVREGLTATEAHIRVSEHMKARMADPNVIVCRRG